MYGLRDFFVFLFVVVFFVVFCLQQNTSLMRYSFMSAKSMYVFFDLDEVDEVDVVEVEDADDVVDNADEISLDEEHTETSSHSDMYELLSSGMLDVVLVSSMSRDELIMVSKPLILMGAGG